MQNKLPCSETEIVEIFGDYEVILLLQWNF
jgi:hypothetical protein